MDSEKWLCIKCAHCLFFFEHFCTAKHQECPVPCEQCDDFEEAKSDEEEE